MSVAEEMSAAPSPALRRSLKQTTPGGFIAWARRRFGRATPRAQVIATPELRLGDAPILADRTGLGGLEEVVEDCILHVALAVGRQYRNARGFCHERRLCDERRLFRPPR